MEIIRPKSTHISAANCNKQVISGDWAFFVMFFPTISHNFTNSIFATPPFTCLLDAGRLLERGRLLAHLRYLVVSFVQ